MTKRKADSLLNLHPVRQMLEDTNISMVARAVDNNWKYHGIIPIWCGGFSPFSGCVCYSQKSQIAQWIANPDQSPRCLNSEDRLVREVLIATHDYLHCWAYAAIAAIEPGRLIGQRQITVDNIDEMIFLHLLTEAVAVVGLEYWYLATLDINDICNIGTTVQWLTTNYHERYLGEYRKYIPGLNIQSKEFLADFVRFYCTGIFFADSRNGTSESARLGMWVRHETQYAATQIRLARQWFSYLSNGAVNYSPNDLNSPVLCNKEWMTKLIAALSNLLWEKMKHNKLNAFNWFNPDRFKPITTDAVDFRFTNYNEVEICQLLKEGRVSLNSDSYKYYLYQMISRLDFSGAKTQVKKSLPLLRQKVDFEYVSSLLSGLPSLEKKHPEPINLLVVN